jgi:hypothetical protein
LRLLRLFVTVFGHRHSFSGYGLMPDSHNFGDAAIKGSPADLFVTAG